MFLTLFAIAGRSHKVEIVNDVEIFYRIFPFSSDYVPIS